MKKLRALSPRQRQVAELTAAGLTDQQIAERLGIRYPTVKTHQAAVRNVLGVRSRAKVGKALERLK